MLGLIPALASCTLQPKLHGEKLLAATRRCHMLLKRAAALPTAKPCPVLHAAPSTAQHGRQVRSPEVVGVGDVAHHLARLHNQALPCKGLGHNKAKQGGRRGVNVKVSCRPASGQAGRQVAW